MESKIKKAEDWLDELPDTWSVEVYNKFREKIKEAQKQAIEAALELAAEKSKMTSFDFNEGKHQDFEEATRIGSVEIGISRMSIFELVDSEELKVL